MCEARCAIIFTVLRKIFSYDFFFALIRHFNMSGRIRIRNRNLSVITFVLRLSIFTCPLTGGFNAISFRQAHLNDEVGQAQRILFFKLTSCFY